MLTGLSAAAARLRLILTRHLTRLGFREDSFLLALAFIIGILTAAAAVAFHELINLIRRLLYSQLDPSLHLYSPRGVIFLVLFPTLGGIIVGIISNHIIRAREGRGIIDVLEQVIRSSGNISPSVAIEKIVTSAITIGTGGSAGAEGPIVQIGAAISSGVGQFFRITRQQMPVLIGCGSAAGISAIFNAPIGGVLFTLEVILRDFSIRTFTPVVIASVVANFATRAIFRQFSDEAYVAIFHLPPNLGAMDFPFSSLGNFALLGLICGLVGVSLTRLMYFFEHRFEHSPIPRTWRPAAGGALLGVLGLLYVAVVFLLFHRTKFIPFDQYAMPAFFGDGYGAVRPMLSPDFYLTEPWLRLTLFIAFLVLLKILGTCFTLGSGGAGGIIAPSLFLGAVSGALLGLILGRLGLSHHVHPNDYALIGIGAVLAAVVHAPLASTLILFEVTGRTEVTLPGILACILATSTAQLIFKDSIYTLALRQRGVRLGSSADIRLLQRLIVEQVDLEPAVAVHEDEPLQRLLDLTAETNTTDFIVVDKEGLYEGMVVSEDLRTALLQREAIPLLLVEELMRPDLPPVRASDDLATVLDAFARHEVSRLPVCLSRDRPKIIGLISRPSLMKRYQRALAES
jgi:CIC family chloride channel protein